MANPNHQNGPERTYGTSQEGINPQNKTAETGYMALIREETALAAEALAEHTEGGKRLDLDTTTELLEKFGLHLGNEIEKSYERDNRYGLLLLDEEFQYLDPDVEERYEELIREDLSDRNKYHQHFQHVTFDKKDILSLIEMLKQGKKILTICTRGGLSLSPLFKKLIIDNETVFRKISAEYHELMNLNYLRQIKPDDLVDLETLNQRPDEEQLAICRAAYQEAKPLEPSSPSIKFTTTELIVSDVSRSPIQDLQDEQNTKRKYLGPIEDLFRFRMEIDEVLAKILGEAAFRELSVEEYKKQLSKVFSDGSINQYLHDKTQETYYPNYLYHNGSFPCLSFEADDRIVSMSYIHPATADRPFRSRLSLG